MILEVNQVTKKFGGLAALSEVSFSVKEGEVLGLIGPNGAGKTTMFNCINGLLPISSGEIRFQGQVISGMQTNQIAKAGIARAFQVVKPFGNMTALENVMVGAFCRTKNYQEAQIIALKALDTVFLKNRVDYRAKDLNLGERKKLEIAKSLATNPRLLLLDEVMAGLTPPEVKEILDVVKQVNQSGVTILIIEHIMEAVMNISNNIVVLNFGKKIAEGTPEEISRNQMVIEAYFGVEEGDESA